MICINVSKNDFYSSVWEDMVQRRNKRHKVTNGVAATGQGRAGSLVLASPDTRGARALDTKLDPEVEEDDTETYNPIIEHGPHPHCCPSSTTQTIGWHIPLFETRAKTKELFSYYTYDQILGLAMKRMIRAHDTTRHFYS